MKTNILSRALLAVGIIAFSAMITAGTCKIEVKGMGTGLVVKSLNADKVKVSEESSATTVTADYDSGTFAATDNSGLAGYDIDVAGTVTPLLTEDSYKAGKGAFTVEIKDAKQGIVLSRTQVSEATIKSLTVGMMKDKAGGEEVTVANAINGFVYNPDEEKGLSFVSAFLGVKGFAATVAATEADADTSIGLVCAATATKATKAKVDAAKTADKTEGDLADAETTFEGAQKATCTFTRKIDADIPSWPTGAVTGTVTELKLTFLGINTGKATFADIKKAVPGIFEKKDDAAGTSSGFIAENLEKLGKEYSATDALQVVVKLVKPAAAS